MMPPVPRCAQAPQDIEVELDRPPEDTHIEPSKPFFLLSQQDQRISTRQLTHGGDRRRRCGSEVATIVYSLANEPWLKYGYACIADCGFTGQQYTASRLSREVLYLETEGCGSVASKAGFWTAGTRAAPLLSPLLPHAVAWRAAAATLMYSNAAFLVPGTAT